MATSHISRLPPELLDTVFGNLSISTLLSFAQTSQANYVLATQFLHQLELAVFPKRIHSVLAFLEEECREDGSEGEYDDAKEDEEEYDDNQSETSDQYWGSRSSQSERSVDRNSTKRDKPNQELYRISRTTFCPSSLPTPPPTRISGYDRRAQRAARRASASPVTLRERQFEAQNDEATKILTARSIQQNLKSLTLHLYTLQTPALATALASLPSLQHLSLNFSHPYIYDTTLPASYWRATPAQGTGSPVWNSLAGVGDEASSALKLRNLRSLTVRRAGITSYQLRSLIMQNQSLTDLCLEKVRGVDLEFVRWLAEYISTQRKENDETPVIQKIILKDCGGLICKRPEELTWVDALAKGDDNSDQCEGVGNVDQYAALLKKKESLAMLSLIDCQGVDDELFLSMLGFEDDSGNNSTYASTRSDQGSSSARPTTVNTQWTRGIRKIIAPKGLTLVCGRRQTSPHERRKQIHEARMLNRINSPSPTVSDESEADSEGDVNAEQTSNRGQTVVEPTSTSLTTGNGESSTVETNTTTSVGTSTEMPVRTRPTPQRPTNRENNIASSSSGSKQISTMEVIEIDPDSV